jgi:hypothetical protein
MHDLWLMGTVVIGHGQEFDISLDWCMPNPILCNLGINGEHFLFPAKQLMGISCFDSSAETKKPAKDCVEPREHTSRPHGVAATTTGVAHHPAY